MKSQDDYDVEMTGKPLEVYVTAPKLYATGVEAMVCEDIAKRQALGLKKYGMTVADNPGNIACFERHLYEELLDACVYLKKLEQLRNDNQPT